jgi:hypothetical protein
VLYIQSQFLYFEIQIILSDKNSKQGIHYTKQGDVHYTKQGDIHYTKQVVHYTNQGDIHYTKQGIHYTKQGDIHYTNCPGLGLMTESKNNNI